MSNTLITPYGAGAMRAHDAAKFLGVADVVVVRV